MTHALVIGSGAAGVHFALRALELGHRVTMLDIGVPPSPTVAPDLSFARLKQHLHDPAHYFAGDDFSGVALPDGPGAYYTFPPGQRYIFAQPSDEPLRTLGIKPLRSEARGGLAQAWTAGCYPFNHHELAHFPFHPADLTPYYEQVASEIGVSGANDDTATFMPLHANLQPPTRLDRHGRWLERTYRTRRQRLRSLGVSMGRTRTATIARDHAGRPGCSLCGRCLWGCPSRSLYTPSVTLQRCLTFPRFTYIPDRWVSHLELAPDGSARAAIAHDTAPRGISGPATATRHHADLFVLAAGTLGSTRLYLHSLRHAGRHTPRLTGLMDNRQILMPFLSPALLGRPYQPDRYQFHQLNLLLTAQQPDELIHCQLTTLKTASVHPVIASLPIGMRAAVEIFRRGRAALGLVNINLHDRRRDTCWAELDHAAPHTSHRPATLRLRYLPPADEPARLRNATRRVARVLRELGCFVPPGMVHVRHMGAAVHYAGTLPMAHNPRPGQTDHAGRLPDLPNTLVIDGSPMPFLPAKNITFTLMALARRAADLALAPHHNSPSPSPQHATPNSRYTIHAAQPA